MRALAHLLKPAGRSLASHLLCHSGASLDDLMHLGWCLLEVRIEQALVRMIVVALAVALGEVVVGAAAAAAAAVAGVDEADTLAEVGGVVVVADSERTVAHKRDSLVDSRAAACHTVEVVAVRCY